jgi:hypothetical protein
MGALISSTPAPAMDLLARLVAGVPGMLVPGLLTLAVCLFVLVSVDRAIDRATDSQAK